MINKVSNALIPIGGITGGFINALPSFATISHTIILAFIGAFVGAIVGYMMKILLDKLFKK